MTLLRGGGSISTSSLVKTLRKYSLNVRDIFFFRILCCFFFFNTFCYDFICSREKKWKKWDVGIKFFVFHSKVRLVLVIKSLEERIMIAEALWCWDPAAGKLRCVNSLFFNVQFGPSLNSILDISSVMSLLRGNGNANQWGMPPGRLKQ